MTRLPFGRALLLAAILAAGAAAGAPPDVGQIAHRLDDLYRSSASITRVELLSQTETQSRHLTMRIWTKGTDRALIVIDEPAREAGTATLRVGNNLWNYLPKIARTIRVPPSMMLGSWMGTDFTNDDLVRETSYEHDFESVLVGPSQDPPGWLLRMQVRPDLVGRWQRIDFVVDDAGELPRVARFYDRQGHLARTETFGDVRTLGGRRIPTRMVLESVDQPGHHMELHFLDARFNAPVKDDMFSLSQLERP